MIIYRCNQSHYLFTCHEPKVLQSHLSPIRTHILVVPEGARGEKGERRGREGGEKGERRGENGERRER